MKLRIYTLISAGIILLSACAAGAQATQSVSPTPTPANTSGIEGHVLIGPACPGPERVDNPCPDKPYQATLTILNSNREIATTVQSDTNGYFKLSLEPGTYILRPESPGVMPSAPEQTVTVVAGQFTQVNVSYDSGIR